ncbi:WXG100 family type VII secretion target [Streptomyces sp. NBC_00365]|uniref:WXG100 family type VII secretion target n=1 Tax=Streptomyces sp. NBC_00365 TaxID=2975726 RepID=UPI00225A2286|nr:WXG100 family type VII secretion target [Streptomyces sp. NBC_00365]MCX5093287.1 WXG100 family type VII secretion target [Streptomyces sp. NBC_00365]
MGYGGYYNAEYYEAQQQAQKQRIKDKHDEKLESTSNGGMGGPDRSKLDTPFMKMGIPELRSMILDADPGRIYDVSQHWKSVHNILSGGDGDPKVGGVDSVSAKDSVAGMMQSAVENVLEHWEGDAAEAFRKKANEIMQNVRNGAAWANYYGETMQAVQNDLRTSMDKMRDVEEPSGWSRAWDKLTDDDRSDEQLLADINKGVSTDAARQANADSLSAGKEKQLEGVAIMEQLGVNYKAYAMRQPRVDDPEPFPSPNPATPMPTPISMPSAGSSRPGSGSSTAKPWSAGPTTSIKPTPTTPRDPGITGGSQLPTTRTNVDSISPGLTGAGPSSGVGGPSVGGGNFGTSGAQGSSIVTPGGTSGLAGGAAAARGGIGAAGGRAGGGAAAGRGAGGRSGMGGMGGGSAGAAGRGGAGAGGRGALARSRGGVVGAAKGVTGKGAGGGAGLHGSRGGTQRGAMAGGAGGAGGRGRRSEEENSQGDRPDYLVEDEETWISEEDRNRNVPRTIE